MLLLLLSLVTAAGDVTEARDTIALSLGQALGLAMHRSPSRAEVSAARLQSGVSLGQGINALLPAPSGSLSWGKNRGPSLANPDSIVTTEGWTGSLTVSQIVFDPRVFAGIASSFINAGYYASDAQEKQAKLVYDVTDGYLALLGARLLLDAAASSLDRAQDNLKLSEEKHRLGAATRIEVMRSEVFKSQAEIQLLSARRALAGANAGFLAVAGISRNVVVRPTEQLSEPSDFTITDDDSLVAEIERRNPGAQLAAKAGAIATVNTVAAAGQILPSVSAYWTSTYADSYVPKSIRDWDSRDRVSTGIKLSFPLFDLKTFVLDICDAVAGSRRTKAAAARARYQLRAAAATAVIGYREAQQRYDYAKRNLELSQELYRLAKEQQRLGAISLLDFFSVETSLAQAQAAYVSALTDTYAEAAQISYLLGRTRPESR